MGRERPGGAHGDPATGEVLTHSAWYDSCDPTPTRLRSPADPHPDGDGPGVGALRRHRVHLFTPDELADLLEGAGLQPPPASGASTGGPPRRRGAPVHRAGAAA